MGGTLEIPTPRAFVEKSVRIARLECIMPSCIVVVRQLSMFVCNGVSLTRRPIRCTRRSTRQHIHHHI